MACLPAPSVTHNLNGYTDCVDNKCTVAPFMEPYPPANPNAIAVISTQ
jgi:hypothetical protein